MYRASDHVHRFIQVSTYPQPSVIQHCTTSYTHLYIKYRADQESYLGHEESYLGHGDI